MQASASTIMQTSTDKAMLGRVGSVVGAIIQVATLISMFAAGIVAEALGTRTVFIISGVIIIVASGMMGVIFNGAESPAEELSANVTENSKLQEA